MPTPKARLNRVVDMLLPLTKLNGQALFDFCRVDIGLEANQGSVTEIEHRALDHRGLREHQFDRFRLVEIGFAFVVEFAKGRARTVQHHLPAVLVAPLGQVFAVDTDRFVVMEVIADSVFIEPGARLFHGVAGFDAEKVQRFA
ncbi:hypothetical protein EMIT051CA3_10441 [Pseudomonas chlororaphis]